MKMFGITNCDTVKRARAWFSSQGIACDFHDYKSSGIDRVHLEKWCRQLGWEKVINRAGMTFRKLPESKKADLNQAKAIMLMLERPGMIKRPIVEFGDRCCAGFSEQAYRDAFGAKGG